MRRRRRGWRSSKPFFTRFSLYNNCLALRHHRRLLPASLLIKVPPSSDDHLSFKFLFPQSIQNFQFLLKIAGHPHRCRPLDWKRIWANRFKFQRNAHIVLAYEQTVTKRETSPPHFLCHLMQYQRKKDIFGAKTAIHVVGLVLRPVRPVQDTTPITLPVQFVHTPLDNWSQKSKKQRRWSSKYKGERQVRQGWAPKTRVPHCCD